MTAFLPPTHTHLYLPMFFKLWEAFNSSIIDERLLELVGELSEEHVAGKLGDAGEEGGAEFKDVGIWSEAEWTTLAGKALGSMSKLSRERIAAMVADSYVAQMSQSGPCGYVDRRRFLLVVPF